jgi:hypothetical protein
VGGGGGGVDDALTAPPPHALQQTLDSIVNLEKLQESTREEIEFIWTVSFHSPGNCANFFVVDESRSERFCLICDPSMLCVLLSLSLPRNTPEPPSLGSRWDIYLLTCRRSGSYGNRRTMHSRRGSVR